MEKRFVVYRLLFPADENSPELIDPRRNPLDDPTPCASAVDAFRGLFLAPRFNMGTITAATGFAADGGGVIPLVAAQMLRTTRCGAGPADRKTVQRGLKEFLVMRVGAGNRIADGNPAAIGQHRTLNAQFASICGIFPGFFPRPRVPWWSIRRDFATSIGCRGARHSAATGTSIIYGRRRVAPIPGSSGATCCRSQTLGEPLSIGSPFAKRRKCRWRFFANPLAVVRHRAICGTWARKLPSGPKGLREYANSDILVRCAYVFPP